MPASSGQQRSAARPKRAVTGRDHHRCIRDLDLGRVIRALRRRRGWRQEDAALRARIHRSTWSLLERGHVDHLTLSTVRRCLAALEVKLDLQPRWRGAELDRLLDEEDATLQAAWKERLEPI
ncbi:MAG TPA: helix-turn-helix domain-containing protein [Candidatus Dormibacteraeota bacterium]|nr:helix-turn-helix domain-containing protein [Candidatus Dormibacteraeota bacterium]